jgi:hypothetical protein
MTDRNAIASPGSGEAGSAYVAVLVVLVVLTILGLALVLVTQTEVQIGVNERQATRVVYAADSGVRAATATVLVTADYEPKTLFVGDGFDPSSPTTTVRVGERIEISPFFPILDAPCNLCSINQGSEFYQVNHAVTARATRIGWTGSAPDASSPQFAQKTISLLVEIQPWQMTPRAFTALEGDLTEIRF